MKKAIDWNATEARAKTMTSEALHAARLDCAKTAKLWSDPDTDPDGNAGYYMDEASVYAREQNRRRTA